MGARWGGVRPDRELCNCSLQRSRCSTVSLGVAQLANALAFQADATWQLQRGCAPPSRAGLRRCSSALPAPLPGFPPRSAGRERGGCTVGQARHSTAPSSQTVGGQGNIPPSKRVPAACRAAQTGAAWAQQAAHLAARRRHAHVVIHLLDPGRQVLHVPWVVLDLRDGDALGRVCRHVTRRARA